jgi:hypothetical protein
MTRYFTNKKFLMLASAALFTSIGVGILIATSTPAYACPSDGGGGSLGGFFDWLRRYR